MSTLPDLVFIDVETSGLNPKKHRVIEVGVARVPSKYPFPESIDVKTFCMKLSAFDLNDASPEALAVNGYRPEHPDWQGAPQTDTREAKAIWQQVYDVTKGAALVGQNVEFDREFVKTEMFNHLGVLPDWQRRFVDTQSFAYEIAVKYGLSRWGLKDVYEALMKHEGAPVMEAHRARVDVLKSYYLFRRTMRILRTA